jgi:ATP-binding cassette, subfamily B, bacterial
MLAYYNDEHWYLGEASAAVERIEEIERDVERTAGVRAAGRELADGLPARSIRFENVSFTYPGASRPVFDGLNLEIEAGRSLGIVGENGAGKTTLVKLLAGLYEPTTGRIIIDGCDLRELSPESWHRRISAVFQDFVAFELTAYDNVAFGALHAARDGDGVAKAARDAGAMEIVDRLNDGWETTLSRQFTSGAQLSSGEWQRLALARALFGVAAGAGLLVLDEPTASLDVRGEAEVYQRFLDLTRGVTTIVISHRFSTVRRADRIVVIEHGCIVEDGTHEELVQSGGRYAAMYRLQASRFQTVESVDA